MNAESLQQTSFLEKKKKHPRHNANIVLCFVRVQIGAPSVEL